MESKITIFTPTYNRGYILPQLYASLCKQTNPAFIWLVVDDGSTDNTNMLINTWISENRLSIKYLYQPNGGKMRAHNRGVLCCETELFFCVDSDDFLAEDSIQLIYDTWKKPRIEKISGIVAYRGFIGTSQLIKCHFPENYQTSALIRLYQNGFCGDTSLIYRTDILKRHLFPEIEGEKFISEAYVYDQIDEFYELILLKQPLIMCQYQSDGYTQNEHQLFVKYPKGWAMFYNQRSRFSRNLKERIVMVAKYISFGLMCGSAKIIRNSNYPVITLFCYPLGLYYKMIKFKS